MIDSIQNMQSSQCGTGVCAPSVNAQQQAPTSRAFQSVDTVKISKQAREQQYEANGAAAGRSAESELNFEQQREVDKLKKTDQEVKTH